MSGIEYAGDAQLSYRISQGARYQTSIEAYAYGRTYSLSADAREQVPDLSGSDFSLGLAEVALSHRQFLFAGAGPTSISVHEGKVRYAGAPLWDYRKISLGQTLLVGTSGQFNLLVSAQDQTARDGLQSDTIVYDTALSYGHTFGNRDYIEASLSRRLNAAEEEDDTFTDYRFNLYYSPAEPVLGTKWTFSAGLGHVNYDSFDISFDGRRDDIVTVGGTATFENLSYFGFSPSISVSATQTTSNVSQFSTTQVQGRFGIQSSF
uniref:Uncharacterized protein n=1 Tax=Yoonia rhodophyticola TaxID=3137370 RepID=A0AAN0MB59_9RHOB